MDDRSRDPHRFGRFRLKGRWLPPDVGVRDRHDVGQVAVPRLTWRQQVLSFWDAMLGFAEGTEKENRTKAQK